MSLRYLKVFRSFRAIDDLDGDRAQIHQIIGLFHFRIGTSTERLLENDLWARQNGPIRVASALVHLAGRRVFVDLLLGLVLVCGQLGHQHAVVCCANDNIVVVHVDNSTNITDLVHSRISVSVFFCWQLFYQRPLSSSFSSSSNTNKNNFYFNLITYLRSFFSLSL